MEPALTLSALLRERIALNHSGSIPFAEFMEQCLYHPQLGYYAGGRNVVGRGGDFFTSVSVSGLFGRLLADEFQRVWRDELGSPPAWQIVEQGANRGDLAADILQHLQTAEAQAFAACEYVIVEPFPALRAAQHATLRVRGVVEKLRHVPSLPAVPEKSVRGVFFSNELPDAFPVRCVRLGAGGWRERRVGWDAELQRFAWREAACDAGLAREIAAWQIPPVENYCAEISPQLRRWASAVAAKLAAGIFLTIDYGGMREELYTAARHAGTLRAYRRHQQRPEVLDFPGEQDLTAHVNFSQILSGSGLTVHEYTDQQRYLTRLGQLRFFEAMERAPSAKLLREFQTLTHPLMLGATFKALTLTI